MTTPFLKTLPKRHAAADPVGITSVCSAHPLVIEAALREGLDREGPVLIEATCNQVNQDGGYTGMTPIDFRKFVEKIAGKLGFDTKRIILGGDHLGPNPWKHLPPEEALNKAETMVESYVRAGFTKIHLDTSMGCTGESEALADETTAERAARLAKVSETASAGSGFDAPVYIIGTEVPVPGGAWEALDHLQVTSAEAAIKTVDVHRSAFRALDLESAFERAIGLVVQPGVEFGNENVVFYHREKATELSAALKSIPQFVFEAHSTDYQPIEALTGLVEDGFSILKVGPGLTFALREALYALDHIANELQPVDFEQTLRGTIERVMLNDPQYWSKYYHGTDEELRLQRHFSYSDRIRYYWPQPEIVGAVNHLTARLTRLTIPETLVSQYLSLLYPDVASSKLRAEPHELMIAAVRRVLAQYADATGQSQRSSA